MITPEDCLNEDERLKTLASYSILDTLPEQEYDDLTFLASQICQTPIALISLVDDHRQWFKSRVGLGAEETPKDVAFCSHAILKKTDVMIIPDSRKDIRFFDNPLVTGDPHVIFYAGVPLVDQEGQPLGTLCVIDNKPKELEESQIKALKSLSSQVIKLLEFRKNAKSLLDSNTQLERQNSALKNFAQITAHDLKSPVSNILMTSELLELELQESQPSLEECKDLVKLIDYSGNNLKQLIEGILKHSQDSKILSNNASIISIRTFIEDLILVVFGHENAEFNLDIDPKLTFNSNEVALKQIFINLITNSLKYNHTDKPLVRIKVSIENEKARFVLSDNGPGIKRNDAQRIFNLFETTSNQDKKGFHGTGIGLATVKSLVEALGGKINLISKEDEGAAFEFDLSPARSFAG